MYSVKKYTVEPLRGFVFSWTLNVQRFDMGPSYVSKDVFSVSKRTPTQTGLAMRNLIIPWDRKGGIQGSRGSCSARVHCVGSVFLCALASSLAILSKMAVEVPDRAMSTGQRKDSLSLCFLLGTKTHFPQSPQFFLH